MAELECPPAGGALSIPDGPARRALVEVLAQAFLDNPMNRVLHGPDPRRRLRANRAGLRSLVLDSGGHVEIRVLHHAGEVVGGFVARRPDGPPLPRPRLRRTLGGLFVQGPTAMLRWGQLGRELKQIHPTYAHWYLAVLGVTPAWWGCGFGSTLLGALMSLVAEDPAPLYLESDRPESIRFYRDRGFEARAAIERFGVKCVGLEHRIDGDSGNSCDPVRFSGGSGPRSARHPGPGSSR